MYIKVYRYFHGEKFISFFFGGGGGGGGRRRRREGVKTLWAKLPLHPLLRCNPPP